MNIETKSGKQIKLRKLNLADFDSLSAYLQGLNDDTRRRFGPHAYDRAAIEAFYGMHDTLEGYVAIDLLTDRIVAYSAVKIGFWQHDSMRLQSYGLVLDNLHDAMFAPSVADEWQGCGVGNAMLSFIKNDLMQRGVYRVILWGGVQRDNDKAVNYYLRNGFKILGEFEYYGWNLDMALELGKDMA